MSGFSLNPGMVRADRFKRRTNGAQGKWYDTIELDMSRVYFSGPTAIDAVQEAWTAYLSGTGRTPRPVSPIEGFFLVVLEPYHQHSHPVMIEV